MHACTTYSSAGDTTVTSNKRLNISHEVPTRECEQHYGKYTDTLAGMVHVVNLMCKSHGLHSKLA